jgi:shingomyelin synthase
VVFALVPEQSWALRVGDTLVTVCTWSMILTAVLHKHRWIVFRRIGVIATCLYSMRTLSQMSTLLPAGYADNQRECRARLNATDWNVFVSRFLEQSLHIGFQQAHRGYLCGDLLFSGHTLAMVLSAFTVSYYSPKKLWLWQYLLHMAAIVGMCCMVSCRTAWRKD